MSDKNADQIKVLYVELAKVAASQDWERILKVAKKSNKPNTIILFYFVKNF
jgi:hypothetical protein